MKNKNLILRYFGLISLIIGIALNIKMYLYEEWPTYLFYVLCFIGIVQAILSFTLKEMKKGWQVFWVLIPVILGFLYFRGY